MLRQFNTYRKKRKIQRVQQEQKARSQQKFENPYFSKTSTRKRRSERPQFAQNCVIWLKKDGWAVLGIILMLSVTAWYFGLYTNTFKVENIEVVGTQYINQEEVLQEVHSFADSSILGFIKRNTFWTLKPEALASTVQHTFDQTYAIESVDVKKTFPDSVTVTIVERIPSVTWVTTGSGSENFYSVDLDGFVTQEFDTLESTNQTFPIVYDDNRDRLGIGWHVVSAEYIAFLLQAHEQYAAATGLSVTSYSFPHVQCQERQYVAEQIFQQEILDSASEEYRDKKRAIQEQFQRGELTIDQSLDELEKLKNEELQQLGEESHTGYSTYQWESVFVPIECDFVQIASELHVKTVSNDGHEFYVYLDKTIELEAQLQNLQSVFNEIGSDIHSLSYIDVRFVDRAYYQ